MNKEIVDHRAVKFGKFLLTESSILQSGSKYIRIYIYSIKTGKPFMRNQYYLTTQGSLSIVCNLNIHCPVQRTLPGVSVLSQKKPDRTPILFL
jgi:hypothetical protein